MNQNFFHSYILATIKIIYCLIYKFAYVIIKYIVMIQRTLEWLYEHTCNTAGYEDKINI